MNRTLVIVPALLGWFCVPLTMACKLESSTFLDLIDGAEVVVAGILGDSGEELRNTGNQDLCRIRFRVTETVLGPYSPGDVLEKTWILPRKLVGKHLIFGFRNSNPIWPFIDSEIYHPGKLRMALEYQNLKETGEIQAEILLEWLLEKAGQADTRDFALGELAYHHRFSHLSIDEPESALFLNPDQREYLADVILEGEGRKDRFKRYGARLLHLLKVYDPRITQLVLDEFKAQKKEYQPFGMPWRPNADTAALAMDLTPHADTLIEEAKAMNDQYETILTSIEDQPPPQIDMTCLLDDLIRELEVLWEQEQALVGSRGFEPRTSRF